MAKSIKVVGGTYKDMGAFRIYSLTTAVTANSTVVTGARAGDLIKTTNATGRASLFVADSNSKAQFLTNA